MNQPLTSSDVSGRAFALSVGLWLIVLTYFAVDLVLGRHFQVDELQLAQTACLLGRPDEHVFVGLAKPYLLPLALLCRSLGDTTTILLSFRLVFFLGFVLNLGLIATAQVAFPSRRGRIFVLALASLLFPFWKFGFEIRHDVLLLSVNLVMFGLTQRAVTSGLSARGFALGGATAGFGVTCLSSKILFYVLPFSLLLIASAAPCSWWRADLRRTGRAALMWLAGFAAAVSVVVIALMLLGFDELMLSRAKRYFDFVGDEGGFSSLPNYEQLAAAVPLIFAASGVFLVAFAIQSVRERTLLHLTPTSVTATYLIWATVVFFKNPQPYPYNDLHLLPFTLLAAVQLAARVRFDDHASRTIAASAVLSALAVTWTQALEHDRYNVPNAHQLSYARAAETLTAPDQSILDGVGLVLTRPPPDPDWQLHSLFMAAYRQGSRRSFADIMAAAAPPVAMTNYRWQWLSKRDLGLLHERYIEVARGFFVLGVELPAGDGSFKIWRPGRYVARLPSSPTTPAMTTDGGSLPDDLVLTLSAGPHRYAQAPEGTTRLLWLGPTASEFPKILEVPRGGHLMLPHF
jgi:hypothetical protein